MRLTAIRNELKRRISVSGELGLLQIVSELNLGNVLTRTLGPKGVWIVRSYIGWKGERSIPYKGCEILPLVDAF